MSFSELTTAFVNTLAVCGLSVLIAVPLGTLLSLFLVRTDVIGRKLVWLALSSQLAVPLYVFAAGWSAGFSYQGWLNLTGRLGPVAMEVMQSGTVALLAVAFIHACASVPWVCLIVSMGLLWSDRSQEEMARLEGGWRRVLWLVVFPKLRPWILASCFWCVLPILTEMVVTNLYQVPTVAEQVYLDASRGALRPLTYVAAIGLCMLPLACFAWIVWLRLPDWYGVIRRMQLHPPEPLRLQKARLPLSLLVGTVTAILVGLPLVNLVAKAGWKPRTLTDGTTSYGWSVDRFFTTVVESLTLFQTEFYWSMMLAASSSCLAMLLACVLLSSLPTRVRPWVNFLMLVLVAVPGPLVGVFTIWVFNRSTPEILGRLYDTTLIAPIVAQQFRLLPLSWLLMQSLLASVSRHVWEMATIDELSGWQRLRIVLVPQVCSRWATCWLLLILISVGELSSTILVLPPGVTTVSMRLFELLHFGMRHQDSGLCGLLLLLGWFVAFAFWKTLNER